MFSAVPWLLWAGVVGAAVGHDDGGSFLYQPAYTTDQVLRAPAEPYQPQPGDLVFCTDHKVFWCVTHSWAGAGHPHHSGIVVARPDGRPAVLEAGPHDTLWIRILDIGPHLQQYADAGEAGGTMSSRRSSAFVEAA